ncbi:DnaJ domain-containing protein [Aquisediminimonas profunda]|uniref:DnaJ domain-containing protein n=1 Tax=Aquisediminimonas profunda TaxID=1550733 RepID=UPI001C62D837|nr:DnaJ domain-containing protein [Aquisediminimonas profunda]
MDDSEHFVDFYKVLQVKPNCDTKVLEASYRRLAKMYHPDHIDTADAQRFNDVVEAYRALRTPAERDKYNILYSKRTGFKFPSKDDLNLDEALAISDADAHARILLHLYKRRREHAQDAGVGRYFVQVMLNCSDEHFEFHIWYLKSKGFIEITEQGTLAITIEGVDHVISMSQTSVVEKLRITQSGDPL